MAGFKEVYKELMVLVGMSYDKKSEAGVNKGIGGVVKQLGKVTLAAGAATIAIGFIAKKIAEVSSESLRMSRSLGIAFGDFQAISDVGQILGVTADETSLALRNFSKSMSEAARGTGEGVEAFGLLGISVGDLNGKLKDPVAAMKEVQKRMEGLSRQRQIDLGTKLGFNRRSIRLIQDGRFELGELMEQRKVLGVATIQYGRDAEMFNMRMLQMKWAFQSMVRPVTEIGFHLAEKFMNPLMQFFTDNPEAMSKFQAELADTIGFIGGNFEKAGKAFGLFTGNDTGSERMISSLTTIKTLAEDAATAMSSLAESIAKASADDKGAFASGKILGDPQSSHKDTKEAEKRVREMGFMDYIGARFTQLITGAGAAAGYLSIEAEGLNEALQNRLSGPGYDQRNHVGSKLTPKFDVQRALDAADRTYGPERPESSKDAPVANYSESEFASQFHVNELHVHGVQDVDSLADQIQNINNQFENNGEN